METKDKKRPSRPQVKGRPAAKRPEQRRVRQSTAGEPPRRRPAPQEEQPRTAPRANAQEQVFRPGETRGTPARTRSPEEIKRAKQRRRSAQRTQERKKQAEKQKNRPAVVYTQPKPINLNKMLLQIAAVLAVVLAITLGLSVFFKVEKVMVYGNKSYDAWTVKEASGIEIGENLLGLGNPRACGKIKTELPYVDTVRIGIKLPDTVNIYITEFDVSYAIKDQDELWWLMTSTGRITEQVNVGEAAKHTKILGVQVENPEIGQQAKALEDTAAEPAATEATDATEATMPALVTAAARLDAALEIMESLEVNDIVGEIASVDVSSLTNIELWYGQRFQVKVGDTSQIDTKLAWMKDAVAQQQEYQMGIMDVSFTTWPDQVGFTPFE